MPMGTEEMKVQIGFQEKSLHYFVEIMENAGDWLETEWWDNEYKAK